jgi:hypothetical protein
MDMSSDTRTRDFFTGATVGAPVNDDHLFPATAFFFEGCCRLFDMRPEEPARFSLHEGTCGLRGEFTGIRDSRTGYKYDHFSSHEWRGECCQQEHSPVSGLDPVNLIGWHDPDNTRDVGDCCSRNRTGPGTFEHVMDLDHPRVGMVTDGTAGIDTNMVEADPAPGIFPGYEVL